MARGSPAEPNSLREVKKSSVFVRLFRNEFLRACDHNDCYIISREEDCFYMVT